MTRAAVAAVVAAGCGGESASSPGTTAGATGNLQEDQYVSDTRAVYRAAHEEQKLVAVGGGSHGINLLDPARTPAAPRLRALLETFVHDHTAVD